MGENGGRARTGLRLDNESSPRYQVVVGLEAAQLGRPLGDNGVFKGADELGQLLPALFQQLVHAVQLGHLALL